MAFSPVSAPLLGPGALAIALALCLATAASTAMAQYAGRLANVIALPIDDPAAVAAGRWRFGALCSIWHGTKGRGEGKGAPCLTCGRFRHGGTATEHYAHISGGIKGALMGAFGTTLERDQILNIIAFIRGHTAERRAAGEID